MAYGNPDTCEKSTSNFAGWGTLEIWRRDVPKPQRDPRLHAKGNKLGKRWYTIFQCDTCCGQFLLVWKTFPYLFFFCLFSFAMGYQMAGSGQPIDSLTVEIWDFGYWEAWETEWNEALKMDQAAVSACSLAWAWQQVTRFEGQRLFQAKKKEPKSGRPEETPHVTPYGSCSRRCSKEAGMCGWIRRLGRTKHWAGEARYKFIGQEGKKPDGVHRLRGARTRTTGTCAAGVGAWDVVIDAMYACMVDAWR